jgi:hypothetical protein
MPIYIPPWTITMRGGGETRNIEIEAIPANIGGGNTAGVAPGCFSALSDVNTIITAMKRESYTSRLSVCGSILSFLSYASMFRHHMSCPT